jgi:elongator complex protein 1
MYGPTKNLTILTCDKISLCVEDELNTCGFESFKIAKHSGAMTSVLAGKRPGSETVCFFDLGSKTEITSEFLHSDDIGSDSFSIKSFHIIDGDWRAVLILSDGRIYRAAVDEFSISLDTWQFEQVGSVAGGISAAEWSPDSSILVLLMRDVNGRVLLTRDFEILEEGPVEVEGYGSEEMISIGWGKKETQFHGTLGKSAAIAVAPVKQETVEGDNGEGRISWRADGTYFAVSTVDSGSGRRVRVYDRGGSLISTSEPIEGLEGPLAWRPNGSVIGSVQFLKAQNKRQVIFFERNGLRHGEFVLPDGHCRPVLDLFWSGDSNVLAVMYAGDEVELWSCSNYHWYLKKRLPVGPVQHVFWDPESSLVISAVPPMGESVSVFSLVWDQDVCESCVAVQDGKVLHLTPMNICNIPPPMSLVQMALSGVPDSFCLSYKGGEAQVAVAFPDRVEIFSVKLCAKKAECSVLLLASHPLPAGDRLVQLEFLSENSFIASNLLGDRVLSFNKESIKVVQNEMIEPVYRLLPHCGRIVTRDLSVLRLVEGELVHAGQVDFKGEWCEFLPPTDNNASNSSGSFLVMNGKGMLWLDENLILTQATSFAVCHQFVMLTTHSHQLIFLPRRGTAQQWESIVRSAMEGQGNEEVQRRIERGGLLVTSVAETSSVILQMPRGNLETISPRAMVLSSLRKHLNSLEYRAAYALCRRHRLDLNILHDNAPEMFMQTIGKFVNDLDSADHLNIFLSSLRDEDVSKTKYSGFAVGGSSNSGDGGEDGKQHKINTVSEAILSVLRLDPVKWIDSIMTVYVVQEPSRVEEALNCVIELSRDAAAVDLVEKSLKYLLFLVPADKLFDVALGMYQLPLALSIGRRSQKDPKDFEPFLESLVRLPALQREFQINDHLQRHPQALKCLYQQSLDADFVAYMEKYQLHKEALEISASDLTDRASLYEAVLNAFGEHLMRKSDHLSAVCLFMRSRNWNRVLEGSIISGSWMEFLEASKMITATTTRDLDAMKMALISTLKSQNRHREAFEFCRAAQISTNFTLQLALDSGLFCEAHLLAGDADLLAGPLEAQSAALLEKLNELAVDVNGKTGRMLRIQKAFITNRDTTPNAVGTATSDASDNLSEMSFRTRNNSTIKTRTTNSSRHSTTSTKKTERNRTRDRPGSPHEREFLLFNLRELISQTHRLAPQVREMCMNLAKFSRDSSLQVPRLIHQKYSEICRLLVDFSLEFSKIQVRPISCFNSNGQAIDQVTGNVIENPLVDHLDAKFELPAEFGNMSSWALGIF